MTTGGDTQRPEQFIAEQIWRPEAAIERSIFGTDDPDEIWRQAVELCPEAAGCFAFHVSVGALFGLELRDGSRVALKVYRETHDQAYLEAVQRVQRHLVETGFPCPKPFGVRNRATLEAWQDEGDFLDAHRPEVRRVIAEKLAELHRLTDELRPLDGMLRDHYEGDSPLWPRPHNVLFDFGATAAGAEWIDEIALAAKPIRDSNVGPEVIGHGDWTVKHFRFHGLTPTVIYDWDSLNTDAETIFVGLAAATFTYTEEFPVELTPSVGEAQAFLAEYEQARGQPFSADERWAAGGSAVYAVGYSARCTHAVGGDARSLPLLEYAEEFL